MSLNTKVRINFKSNKNNINFYKRENFIYHNKVNGIVCSYGFINNNKNINMGKLVPNISNLFGLVPNKEYIRIIDEEGFTIKLKNEDYTDNNIIIINPNDHITIGFKIENK
jgi:hypothetical protein